MNQRARQRFDRQLEKVLEGLPPLVHQLLEQVPLHVEDYPSDAVMRQQGLRYRDELCGYFAGVPIGEKSVDHGAALPDLVTIYREGILTAAADEEGRITADSLRRQIRITILHELAHLHGIDEDELEQLGYQ